MKVGLQVYTVQESFKKDPMGTLDKVADAGYRYIEMANGSAGTDDGTGFGTDLKEFKAKLEERGLVLLGTHVSQMDDDGLVDVSFDRWKRIAEWYEKAGAKYLAVALDTHVSKEKLYRDCERYTKIGRMCKDYGLHLLYHNHFMEFQEYDGVSMFDIMLREIPEDLFSLEVDTFWIMRALVDPGSFIRKYGKRIKILHQKDYTLNTVNDLSVWNFVNYDEPVDFQTFWKAVPYPEQCTEIGYGMMKIQDIINAGNETGVEYILVEQDHSKFDDITSIQISMESLRKMQGIEKD